MKKFKKILALVIIVASIYISLVVLFYGGICQIVYGLQPFAAAEIIVGILKVVFCGIPATIGWIVYVFLIS